MSKRNDIISLIVSVLIIALAISVFCYDVSVTSPKTDDVRLSAITPPETESNKSYGGDAYTGMQQASAQAANNIIPVFEAVQQTNKAIQTTNENIVIVADSNADNIASLVGLVKFSFGSVLLSLGLLSAVKPVTNLLPGRKVTGALN